MMNAELFAVMRTQPSATGGGSPGVAVPAPCAAASAPAGSGLKVELRGVRVDFSRPVHAVLGLPFDALGLDEAAHAIRRSVAARQPCFWSTPNVNFLVGTRRSAGFRHSVLHSDLSVADGMPIVWWARQLGVPLAERVAGADVFERLRGIDSGSPVRVYFYGGPDGVAMAASQALAATGGPGLLGVGGESPGFVELDDIDLDATAARINASGADFVLVALGAQKGQAWIERIRSRLKAPVIAHLGAVVNFAAHTVRRAPVWTRKAGLEWFWRILQEPALWRRYAGDALALGRLLLGEGLPTWRYLRQSRAGAPATPRLRLQLGTDRPDATLHLGGAWLDTELRALREGLSQLARSARPMRLVFERDAALGTAAMGLLMLLEAFARDLELPLRAEVADPRLARVLALNGLRFSPADQASEGA